MFHEMHLGVAVQLPQQSATSLVLKDLRIGIALCKHTPLVPPPEQLAVGGARTDEDRPMWLGL
jgi:hypothetical protein